MRSLIIAHETRALVKSKSLAWILILVVLAMGFAAWAGGNIIERQQRGADAAIAFEENARNKMRSDVVKYEEELRETGGEMEFAAINHAPGQGPPQGVNAGAVGAETSAYAVLPPTGLAAMSTGQNDILLTYVPINMRNIFDTSRENELENPINLQTGSFDVSFVIIFLLPIFILAMTYDLLSSEKERGTLAMIMTHPVSLRELMASKLISRARILLTLVLILGVGVLLTVGAHLNQAETWIRFGFWVGATMLYSMFWFALAVLVNAFGKNSATNGILLAGGWLVFVVLAPTIVSVAATTAYPTPSRMDLTIAARDSQTAAEGQFMQALDEYYYDHLEYVPAGTAKARDFLTLSIANSEAIEKSLTPVYARFQEQLNHQEAIVQRFQYLSPAIMMQLALNEISGTSADRYEHFMDQVFNFHDEWKEFFSIRFLKQEPMTSATYDAFPVFNYEKEPLGTALLRIIPSMLGLLVLFLGVTFWAFASLKHYKVGAR